MIRYMVEQTRKYMRLFMEHKTWKRIMMMLSSIVVFVTVYMMILHTITLESTKSVPGIELDPAEADRNYETENVDELYDYEHVDIMTAADLETNSLEYADGYIYDLDDEDVVPDTEITDDEGYTSPDQPEEVFLEGIQIAEGPDYTVTADVPKTACIPEGAVLAVDEVTNEEYDFYYAQAEKALALKLYRLPDFLTYVLKSKRKTGWKRSAHRTLSE